MYYLFNQNPFSNCIIKNPKFKHLTVKTEKEKKKEKKDA
jgi:hypothetical protein